jgi:hypothetical protein
VSAKSGLALLDLNDGSAPVKAAMSAGAVRLGGLAAIGAGAPLRLGQTVVCAPLVLHALGSSSFRYRHRFSPIFLRKNTAELLFQEMSEN